MFVTHPKLFISSKYCYSFLKSISDYKTVLTEHHGPLKGIRILDLSRILAGPFCTMILGDLGAEVLKVEKPDGGDDTRSWGPPFVKGESAYFLCVNRNKKSITIDFKQPEGKKLIQQLAVKSDVFVENFVPGKLSDLGLGYENLHAIAPHLIYCSITGYGPSGPYSKRAGYDIIAASIGGLLGITGPEEGNPCKPGVAMTDLATGLYAHGAIMAALIQRSKTRRGQKINCDLLSTQVSLLANIASNYLNCGNEAKRWGTAHASIVPYETFKTMDGFLTVGAGSDRQFKVLCKLLNLEHMLNNPMFLTNETRVKNRKHLISNLRKMFAEFTNEHWLKIFEGSGIPYGPVNNISEVFKDPQILYNKMVQDIEHPTAGNIKVLGPAVTFSESVNEPQSPPPLLGQHTNEILSEVLNFSQEDLKAMQNRHVI